MLEVLDQLDAEQTGRSPSHVAVAGEVAVDLDGEAVDADGQLDGAGLYLLDHMELQGTDILFGDEGSDYIVVSGKNSVAHGGADNDYIRADELWDQRCPASHDHSLG